MSREIKFRAWYSSEEYPEATQMLFVGDDQGTTHPLDCCKYFMEGQPVTLMQYTGLKDKNGVEIYEGDIVAGLGVVEWDDSGAWKIGFMLAPSANLKAIEVIGNIHESPELLKEKE